MPSKYRKVLVPKDKKYKGFHDHALDSFKPANLLKYPTSEILLQRTIHMVNKKGRITYIKTDCLKFEYSELKLKYITVCTDCKIYRKRWL